MPARSAWPGQCGNSKYPHLYFESLGPFVHSRAAYPSHAFPLFSGKVAKRSSARLNRYNSPQLRCNFTADQNQNQNHSTSHPKLLKTETLDRAAKDSIAVGALAVGACAFGAVAIGALAIGALAIRRLKVMDARMQHLELGHVHIGHLSVDRLDFPKS